MVYFTRQIIPLSYKVNDDDYFKVKKSRKILI
jgi:hypothetical protein